MAHCEACSHDSNQWHTQRFRTVYSKPVHMILLAQALSGRSTSMQSALGSGHEGAWVVSSTLGCFSNSNGQSSPCPRSDELLMGRLPHADAMRSMLRRGTPTPLQGLVGPDALAA
jgi:hypothetical protein